MLTNEEIKDIYNKVDIPKYDGPKMEYNDGTWKWENKEFSRVISLIEFRKMSKELNLKSEKMLVINGEEDPEIEFIPTKDILHGVYIHDVKYDLHKLDLENKDYDFIMCNQTLEHVCFPQIAMKNLYDHLLPGGYLYMNVPCNNIPHDTPFHYYGFTSVGLGIQFKISNFEIVRLGQWGNIKTLTNMFNNKWEDYRNSEWNNDENCPAICWCLGRKKL